MIFGLIIGVIILAILLVFASQNSILVPTALQSDPNTQIKQVEQQVEEYKQNLNKQETEIFDQINNSK